MDGFTAGIVLDAVKKAETTGDLDGVIDLCKSLKNSNDGPPTQEVIDLVTSWIGKPCKIKGTDYDAVVHSVNMSSGGFYPGSRFPVYVTITSEGKAKNKVFEYGLDQVVICQ